MARNKFAHEIGLRIAARRKQLGLTQEQAAEKADLTQQFFASVETGTRNIRAESIVKVCKALDMSADYLLTGTITSIDQNRVLELLKPLNVVQYLELEDIIRKIIKFSDSK